MRKNKQSARSLTAFLVTWAFVVLTVTGIVLYVVPQAEPDEKLRSLAERHGVTPMDLLKVMLVPGFRPGA